MIGFVRRRMQARLSVGQRGKVAQALVRLRQPTGPLRKLPDFLVLGAQRSGTSSLYRYLVQHPRVRRPMRKEVRYFTRYFHEGPSWYRSHFPLRLDPRMSFDATPDYLFDPRAPERVAQTVGTRPLIVLLRDPVERAWSHYHHMLRHDMDPLSFEEAVAAESERMAQSSPEHPERSFWRHSYQGRGRYAEQLERWFAHFPRDAFHIVIAEEFFADPGAVLEGVERFVGLSEWRPEEFRNWSYTTPPKHSAIPDAIADHLTEGFAHHNQALSELLGRPLPWRGMS